MSATDQLYAGPQLAITPTIPAGRLLRELKARPATGDDPRAQLTDAVERRLDSHRRMMARYEHGVHMLTTGRDLEEVKLYLGM